MSIVTPPPIHREPELLGQSVVVIGGSAGIGFETARRARAEGARVILTGRNAESLEHAASEVDALTTDASPIWTSRRFAIPSASTSCRHFTSRATRPARCGREEH